MPRINFTVRTIDALKPHLSRVEYWDDSLPGFGIRISSEGKKSWVYMYRMGTRLRRYTIGVYPGLSLANARQRAIEARYAIVRGEDPAHQKIMDRRAETFADLVTEYIEHHAKIKKKSWREDERILSREFLPIWRHSRAKSISRREVILALDSIVGRNSPILANKALAILRKTFNFAIQRDIVELNPCWNIPTPARPRSRDRVLNSEEIRMLWGGIEREDLITSSYYKLLIYTAQRSGELAWVEWVDIDLNAGWWIIPAAKTKNGLPHRVPLSKMALTTIKTLRLHSGGSRWVFPSPKKEGSPIRERKRAFRRLIEKSSVAFRPHDLRRTVASQMTSIGISRLTVSKLLNHSETSVTAVYDRHSYDREKREAIELWEAHLLEVLRGEQQVGTSNYIV